MLKIPADQVAKHGDHHTAAPADTKPAQHGEGNPAYPRGPPAADLRTLTIAGVKARYGWSRSKTYQLLGEGKLRACKLGTRLLIFADSCDELIAALPTAKIKPWRMIAAAHSSTK
jgi:hypothetical protein